MIPKITTMMPPHQLAVAPHPSLGLEQVAQGEDDQRQLEDDDRHGEQQDLCRVHADEYGRLTSLGHVHDGR